jgi:hypothetical protein
MLSRSRQFSEQLLDALVSAGLPYQMTGGERHFDSNDLLNLELHLGLRSSNSLAMRYRAAALRIAATSRVRYQVRYSPEQPDADGSHRAASVLTETGWRPCEPSGTTLYTAIITRDPHVVEFDADVVELLQHAARYDFFTLPGPLRADADFVRATGLAECRGATAAIMAEAQRRRITCREAFGLLLSPPFSIVHMWVEFLTDRQWVAADPVLLRALATWGHLDPDDWPVHRSPGACMVRLGDTYGPLVRSGERPVRVSLPTERIPIDAPPPTVPEPSG